MQTSQSNTQQQIKTRHSSQEDTFNIQDFIFRMLANWRWIAAFLVLCVLSAFFYLRYSAPVYKATAKMMIRDDKKGGSGLDNILLKELNIQSSSQSLESEIEILKSYDMIESVVLQEQLYIEIKSKGRIVDREIFANEAPVFFTFANPDTVTSAITWHLKQTNEGKWYIVHHGEDDPLHVTPEKWYIINGLTFRVTINPAYTRSQDEDRSVDNEYLVRILPIDLAVNDFLQSFRVSEIGDKSAIVSLEMTGYNMEKATTSLKSLINIYTSQGLEDKKRVNSNTLDFLNERVALVERELQAVERQVERFKRDRRVTDVSAEAHQYMQQTQVIDMQKAEQQTQLSILEGLERKIRNEQQDPKLVPSTVGIAEPTLLTLIQQHNELVLDRERRMQNYGPKNPAIIDMDNNIANMRQSMLANINTLKASFRTALGDITRREATLASKISTIPGIEKDLVEINRDQNVKQQLYLLLLQKREETAIALASTNVDTRIVEVPRSIGKISPRTSMVYAIALGLGLLLPIGLIYLRDMLNDKVESKLEVEEKSHAPLLGEVSFSSKTDSPIVITKGSRSVIAEQFRVIRTNISFTGRGKENDVILVTSHRPSEGKSFTSLNLAASYALLNKKVVVLEFDLRKPRLRQNLNIKVDTGISNFLNGSSDLDSMLKEVQGFEKNFWLLGSGPIPPNPAELILGDRMKQLITELKKRFDYIIFDTPPYNLVTDSSLLAAFADISIVVLRSGYTFKFVLNEINRKKEENPDQPLYTILNRVDEKNRYGAYRNYGYGYAEYFDTPEKKSFWEKLLKR